MASLFKGASSFYVIGKIYTYFQLISIVGSKPQADVTRLRERNVACTGYLQGTLQTQFHVYSIFVYFRQAWKHFSLTLFQMYFIGPIPQEVMAKVKFCNLKLSNSERKATEMI